MLTRKFVATSPDTYVKNGNTSHVSNSCIHMAMSMVAIVVVNAIEKKF